MPVRGHLIDGLGMHMDVYPPAPGGPGDLPLVVILQGASIDKSSYSRFAAAVQSVGYGVVVPNCIPPGRDYICPDETAAYRALASLERVDPRCARMAAASGVLLVGHSAGGRAAFDSVDEWPGSIGRLKGIAVYGSNAPRTAIARPNGPPVMMICGVKDAIVTPDIARRAFNTIAWRPKALVEVPALDHFAIVDSHVDDAVRTRRHARPVVREADRIGLLARVVTAFFGSLTSGNADWSAELAQHIPGLVIRE